MAWQVTPHTIALVAAGIFSALLAIVAYGNRDTRGASSLIGILASATVWCFTAAVQIAATTPSVKVLALKVSLLGPIVATPCLFLFAATYTNREHWLAPRRVAALFAFHSVTFVIIWTNSIHRLMIREASLGETAGLVYLEITWGPWDLLHTGYSYLLLASAALMLLAKFKRARDVGTYRGQTATILVGMAVPWVLSIAYVTRITLVDLTAVGFTVTGAMIALALFRYRILEVVPIGRSSAIDDIDQGYLVLDPNGTIIDVNETATALFGADRSALVGNAIQDMVAEHPHVLETLMGSQETHEQIHLHTNDGERFFDLDVSPIHDQRGRFIGRVILYRDVTQQERRKRRLERQKTQLESQNERLEEFAGIVAHDLRNPINVLRGHLELLQETDEDEHVDAMGESIERMEAIVEDVLAMARQGQAVDETEPLDLAVVCEKAWRNVDTDEATLDVRCDRTVEADRARLLRVFENLFRNSVEHSSTSPRSQAPEDAVERSSTSPRSQAPEDAVEHGRSDVTITVGELPDGFYVEDDGPGIPAEEREEVFEKGYSSASEGTGFGLPIVETAVEAHGWDITVTEAENDAASAGSDGSIPGRDGSPGARFEITGLQNPEGRDAHTDRMTRRDHGRGYFGNEW